MPHLTRYPGIPKTRRGGYPLPSLRRYRRSFGLSVKALARASGVSPVTIERIEIHDGIARYSTIAALASALHVKPEVLTHRPPAPPARAAAQPPVAPRPPIASAVMRRDDALDLARIDPEAWRPRNNIISFAAESGKRLLARLEASRHHRPAPWA